MPRQHDDGYLRYIRAQPCCICGDDISVEAAHLRAGSIAHDKPPGALQMKSDDRFALPLCGGHHREQHTMNEREFWASYGLDPFALCFFYQVNRDDELRERR